MITEDELTREIHRVVLVAMQQGMHPIEAIVIVFTAIAGLADVTAGPIATARSLRVLATRLEATATERARATSAGSA